MRLLQRSVFLKGTKTWIIMEGTHIDPLFHKANSQEEQSIHKIWSKTLSIKCFSLWWFLHNIISYLSTSAGQKFYVQRIQWGTKGSFFFLKSHKSCNKVMYYRQWRPSSDFSYGTHRSQSQKIFQSDMLQCPGSLLSQYLPQLCFGYACQRTVAPTKRTRLILSLS